MFSPLACDQPTVVVKEHFSHLVLSHLGIVLPSQRKDFSYFPLEMGWFVDQRRREASLQKLEGSTPCADYALPMLRDF